MSDVTTEQALQLGRSGKPLRLTHRGVDVTLSVPGRVAGGGPSVYISAEGECVIASAVTGERPAVNREYQAANIQVSGSGCHAFFAINPADVAAAQSWINGVFGTAS